MSLAPGFEDDVLTGVGDVRPPRDSTRDSEGFMLTA
jgi:hypothetical protein